MFRLKSGWKIEGRDICWLETLAIELISYYLEATNVHDIFLLMRSDNDGTIGAMHKARSPNRWINLSIRRTYAVLSSLAIEPKLFYIDTKSNPADPLSRGIMGPPEKKLPLLFTLPEELQDIIEYV
jgi:hypothetical protein